MTGRPTISTDARGYVNARDVAAFRGLQRALRRAAWARLDARVAREIHERAARLGKDGGK
jgi:hypothetical protein